VRRIGGRVLGADPILNSVIATVPSADIEELAAHPRVRAIFVEPIARPLLDIAAGVDGVSSWWGAGHTGGDGGADVSSADAAVLGESPDSGHPAFSGLPVDVPAGAPAGTDHGTHTAGALASRDAAHRGIAFGADRLLGADLPSSTIGRELAWALGVSFDDVVGAADPAETVSKSLGAGALNDQQQTPEDVAIALFGPGYAAASGNGGAGGDETAENIGRNMLSVGAYDDHDTATTADDTLAAFSGRGPTPGGRKKPDLIAPGVGITSPSGLWNTPPANPDFTEVDGTSFSAPQVAGAMALLEGAGIGDPKVQRALLINSARDWPGQTHWQTDTGWGALDLSTAFADRGKWASGEVADARFYRASVTSGSKATLAWELRGTWPSLPTGLLSMFTVTNLDLRQYRASDLSEVPPPSDPGHGAGPDALDGNDTVEQLRAPAGGAQDLIYKVDAASAIEGADAEPFALAAKAPLEELAAPRPELDGPAIDPTGGTAGCAPGSGDVEVTTAVRNDSDDLDASEAQVTLELPAGVQLVSGSATQPLSGGTLESETTSEEHSWTIRATTSGAKQLALVSSGGVLDETFTDRAQLAFAADCTPAGANPTSSTANPSGEVECGTPVAIATRLHNPSPFVDATQASVALELPANVELLSGAASQSVSGGTLEAGTTSEERRWTVRQNERGTATATVRGAGNGGGASVGASAQLTLSCSAREEAKLKPERPKLRAGRILARGRIAGSAAGGTPSGKVELLARRGRHTAEGSAKLAPTSNSTRARFGGSVKVCTPGRWKLTAVYGGSRSYAPLSRTLGRARVKKRELRC
jgi:serine protease AprX